MCLEFLWKLCLSSKQTHKPVKCLKSNVVNDMFQTNSFKSLCRLPPQDTGWVEWVCNFTFGDLLVLPAQKSLFVFSPSLFCHNGRFARVVDFCLGRPNPAVSSKKSKNGITDFSPMLWKKTPAVRLNFTCACDVHFQSDMSVLNIYKYMSERIDIYIYIFVILVARYNGRYATCVWCVAGPCAVNKES